MRLLRRRAPAVEHRPYPRDGVGPFADALRAWLADRSALDRLSIEEVHNLGEGAAARLRLAMFEGDPTLIAFMSACLNRELEEEVS